MVKKWMRGSWPLLMCHLGKQLSQEANQTIHHSDTWQGQLVHLPALCSTTLPHLFCFSFCFTSLPLCPPPPLSVQLLFALLSSSTGSSLFSSSCFFIFFLTSTFILPLFFPFLHPFSCYVSVFSFFLSHSSPSPSLSSVFCGAISWSSSERVQVILPENVLFFYYNKRWYFL